MKNHFLRWSIAVSAIAILATVHSCTEDQENFEGENHLASNYDAELSKSISDYKIVKIDYDKIEEIAKQKPSSPVELDLGLADFPNWNFTAVYDTTIDEVFPKDAETYVITGEDTREKIAEVDLYALEATLKGDKEDRKSFFFINNGTVEGNIVENGEEYALESVSRYDQSAPADLYVVYNVKNLISDGATCAADPEAANDLLQKESQMETSTGNTNRGPYYVQVTCLGDYQYRQKFYSLGSAFSYMSSSLYWANRCHVISSTYARLIKKIYYIYDFYGSRNYPPRTWWNYSTFLSECTQYYNYYWYQKGDLNYFFTGDNTRGPSGDVIGVAYLGTICRYPTLAFGYGEKVGSYYTGGRLMAHETGHNMGASHVNGYNIMSPYLTTSNYFWSYTKTQFFNTLNAQNSCLH